jgi:hypothetical protein
MILTDYAQNYPQTLTQTVTKDKDPEKKKDERSYIPKNRVPRD